MSYQKPLSTANVGTWGQREPWVDSDRPPSQGVDHVETLPGELRATEMPVGGRVGEDRRPQLETLDDRRRFEVEDLTDHVLDLLRRPLGAKGLDVD